MEILQSNRLNLILIEFLVQKFLMLPKGLRRQEPEEGGDKMPSHTVAERRKRRNRRNRGRASQRSGLLAPPQDPSNIRISYGLEQLNTGRRR